IAAEFRVREYIGGDVAALHGVPRLSGCSPVSRHYYRQKPLPRQRQFHPRKPPTDSLIGPADSARTASKKSPLSRATLLYVISN
ncbi:MAG TPA: hypothetical protein VGM85_00455, partial [Paraburkholderia sp.]